MDAKKRICCLGAFLAFVLLFFGAGSIVFAVEPPEKRVSLSGWFVVIWQDRLPVTGESPAPPHEPPRYFLIDGKGRWVKLAVDEEAMSRFGGLMAFNRRHVRLEGRWLVESAGVEQEEKGPEFRVEAIRREQNGERLFPMAADAEAVVSGSQPWATILCRFADSTAITPRERSWFDGLMLGQDYPAMNHYWREISFDQINLAGSRVVGWHDLPRPRSYYVYDTNGDGVEDADLPRLTADCAAVADAEIYFPSFFGINLVFNQSLGCCSWGGAAWLSLDGQGKMYGATWIAAENGAQAVWAHEMGHGFGLMHSSGPYNNTYDSAWDVMSNPWWTCSVSGPHQVYGCIGQHTIGWHKDLLGWIASERLYTAAPGSSVTIEIARLNQSSGYSLAKIPIAGSSADFYAVEARQRIGYDNSLPGDAVVIHRVNTGRWDRIAQVVDVDNNGNPNDEGAMWLPGETFVDAANSIEVSVVGATAVGFLVTIKNGGHAVPFQVSTGGQISQKLHYVPSSNSFYGIGSDNAIWEWDNSSKQWIRITGCCIKDDFHFFDESNIYAIGLDNQVWHWNGWLWSQASEGGRFQQKIWYSGSGGYIYGIGLDGQIWRMIWRFGSAAEWTKITSGQTNIKDDFHFISESDIYGIGLDGQIWKWNGTSWSRHSSGGAIKQKLHFINPTEMYGIGADNRIWGWSNGSWSALHDNGQIKDGFIVEGNTAYGIGLDGQIWQLSSD